MDYGLAEKKGTKRERRVDKGASWLHNIADMSISYSFNIENESNGRLTASTAMMVFRFI